MSLAGRLAALPCTMSLLLGACTTSAAPGGPAQQGPPSSSASGTPTVLTLRVSVAPFSLAAPIQREVAVESNGLIYLAGGLDSSGRSASGVFSLDPATGKLEHLGDLPQPFHDAAGAMIGGRLFVFGGGSSSGQGSDAVQAFDVSARTGSVAGHLPVALSDLASATVGDTVYLVGGYDGRAPRSEILATTDGAVFRTVAELPVGLRYPAVTVAGGRVVIAGGQAANGPVATVSTFDPTTGRVSALARLPSPVGHAVAFELGGHVYVAGGQDARGSAVRSVTRVDITTATVRSVRPLPRAVSDSGVAEGDATGWLIGGLRGSAVADILRATLAQVAASAT